MRRKPEGEKKSQSITAEQLVKDRQAITKLAQSKEAQSLMDLLRQSGDVQQAAKSAAKGDSAALVSMLEQLVRTQQGAQLIGQIENQVRQAGLEKP